MSYAAKTMKIESPSGRDHFWDGFSDDAYCGVFLTDSWSNTRNVTHNVDIDAPGLCKKCREVMLR